MRAVAHVRVLAMALISLALVASTAACGGSTSKERVASGTTLAGDGYEVTLPVGWRVEEPKRGEKYDTGGSDPVKVDGVTTRLRIQLTRLQTTVDEGALEDYLRSVMKRLGRAVPDAELLPATEIDGEPALRFAGQVRSGGRRYATEQIAVGHGTGLYTITFTFARGLAESKREDQVMAVLRSWTWG